MNTLSRRQLSEYAANQLEAGQSVKKLANQLVAALIESRKIKDAELLLQDVAWELEKRGKLAQVHVTSAVPLNNALRKEISKLIKNRAAVDNISIEENVNTEVLGGIRIETAVHSWDKTIAKQLKEIREAV